MSKKNLAKLLQIGSPTSLAIHHPIVCDAAVCPPALLSELNSFLSISNGMIAFESALRLFGSTSEREDYPVLRWNESSLWRSGYKHLDPNGLFFAEDVFGGQFLLGEGGVSSVDPETAETKTIASTIEEWAGLILDDYDFYTGHSLAHYWQAQHGSLKGRQRLMPKIPFNLGGKFEIENLYAADCVKSMQFRADLALQLKGLPDGQKVRLKPLP